MRPIGILGGGQLARMLALAAHNLGLRCRVYDPAADPPAAAVAKHHRGRFDHVEVLRQFGSGLSVVTYEVEHLPIAALEKLAGVVDLYPGLSAIRVASDRLVEKNFVNAAGIQTAAFAAVDRVEDVDEAIDRLGLPLILKTRTQGYDGRGQAVVQTRREAIRALRKLGGSDLIAESLVRFDSELSIIAVRSRTGQIAAYPLVENHHGEGILRWTLAPAPELDRRICRRAEKIARRLLAELDYVGVLCVELFRVGDTLLVNEIAPRVHNSGHWTIEGAETSQFENHLRAILGLPLGSTEANGNWVLFNLLGRTPDVRRVLELPGAHLHLYDKSPRPGRKLGHVNYRAGDPRRARVRLQSQLGLS
jgi:5-(carboxyamino)imidazole ribonucleotide synthase